MIWQPFALDYAAMLKKTDMPLALTALRAILGPVIVLLALYYPSHIGFGLCLVIAFLSDVFDGIIARRLNVATPNLRRLDSLADTIFYVGALFAAFNLHKDIILDHRGSLVLLAVLEVTRYVFDLYKFGREASYHMWTSKLWGICLFYGFMALLIFDQAGPVTLAIYIGIVSDLEGLLISLVLKEWKSDVPTIFHAVQLNRSA